MSAVSGVMIDYALEELEPKGQTMRAYVTFFGSPYITEND